MESLSRSLAVIITVLSGSLALADPDGSVLSSHESEPLSRIVDATEALRLIHPWITDETHQNLKLTDTFLREISFRERCTGVSFPCSVLLSFDQLSFPLLVQQNKEDESPLLLWGIRTGFSSTEKANFKDCQHRGTRPSTTQGQSPKETYEVIETLDCCCYEDPETGGLTVQHTEKMTTYDSEDDCRIGVPQTESSIGERGPTESCPCGIGECSDG